MGRPMLIFVSGFDGSGKSTVAKALASELRRRGLPVVHIWFRFPYLLLYPLLLIARVTGLTKVIECQGCGKAISIHYFERVRGPYLFLAMIDFTIHYIARVVLRLAIPIVLIVERGPADTLIDIMSDISAGPTSLRGLMGRYLLSLQKRGITIFTEAGYGTIRRRRPETGIDPKARLRYAMYRAVFGTILRPDVVVDTERPEEMNAPLVTAVADAVRRWYGFLGYGKLFRNPYLRATFANRWVILITNWLIQGAFIADPLENAVRTGTDAAALAATLLVTGDMTIAVVALVIVHTLNYVINSNAAHVIRFFKKSEPARDIALTLEWVKSTNIPEGVAAVAVLGSYVRGEEGEHSDIDVRVIREEGAVNALRAYAYLLRFRIFAIREGVPLDLFMHSLRRFCVIVKEEEVDRLIIVPDRAEALIREVCKVFKP